MRKLSLILILLLCLAPTHSFGQTFFKPKSVNDLSVLASLPVLDEGRVKPLDTYARNTLLRLSGRQTFEKKPAIDWFAKLLLAPDTTRSDKIFLINNPQIAQALGIEEEKKRRYSFDVIEPVYERLHILAQAANQIEKKHRDIVEAEILRLYSNVNLYSKLSLSFSFAFPHPSFVITQKESYQRLNFSEDIQLFSFLDFALKASEIQAITEGLERKDKSRWTATEAEVISIVAILFQWSSMYKDLPLNIIPAYEQSDESWYSPWDSMSISLKEEQGRNQIMLLRDLMAAYWNGEQITFNLKTKSFISSVAQRLEQKDIRLKNLNLEITFNKVNPHFWAKFAYLLTLFLFLFSLIKPNKLFHVSASILITTGFILQTYAIICRMIILQRPPVSNLYETFVFVAFVSVLIGLFIERSKKNWIGHVIASISGFCFLTIASKFAIEGDTMQMLVAVLDSNFWLSTHVLTITIGYAGTCVAGIIGHIYIFQAIFKSSNKDLLRSTEQMLHGTLGFALIMTFLGTNLGGIWADQSWGRFWGWDPKENGALMIVIWTALLFHAKIARVMGTLGLAIGSALGIIVVMWAWFGVNLLNIGLHSYGFTSGLAINLSIYLILQLLFLIIAGPIANNKLKGKK